ncbi:MAG: hypothetical protein ACLSAH_04415 [Bilophila wadsworthia]
MNCTKRGMPPSPPRRRGFRSSAVEGEEPERKMCRPQPPEPVCSVWTSTQPG